MFFRLTKIALKKAIQDSIIAFKISRSGLFNNKWYLQENPDVAVSGINPIFHYINFGAVEKRNPNPLFHTAWYLTTNPDVAVAEINPFYHYIEYGWKEKRSPSEFFNLPRYLEQHPDVAIAGYEPLSHYQKYGWKEGHSPNEPFEYHKQYLNQDSEAENKAKEPLVHYLSKNEDIVRLASILAKKYGAKASLEKIDLLRILQKANEEKDNLNDDRRIQIINGLKQNLKKLSEKEMKNNNACEISIIIPVHNQLSYTLACVISILQLKTKHSYEILIGDDASTDSTQEVFSNLHSTIKLIHQKKNLGFLKTCNAVAKKARGKYLLFLNNDTMLLPSGLEAMVKIFNSRPDVGLVGAKLVNKDGTLQEAGGIIWRDASGCNYGRGNNSEEAEYNYVREVDYCSGACLMILNDLWKEIGGFDEQYSPAYYEDTDLAFKVRARGKKVLYQPKSEVIHFEGISHGRDSSKGIKASQAINQQRFLAQWEMELKDNHFPVGEDLFLARGRSVKRKTILFIDHTIPTPNRDAGSKSVVSYMRFFIRQGFHVILLGDNGYANPPDVQHLQQMSIEVLLLRSIDSMQEWLVKYGRYIDYAFLSRAHTSLHWVAPLRKSTTAKILFYGHDLISRTEERAYQDTRMRSHQLIAQDFKRHEKAIHPLVDIIYYPSQVEVDYLSEKLKEKEIRKIPLYVLEQARKGSKYNAALRSGLLFIGGFRHPPNLDAVLYFINHIFPKVLTSLPDLQLTIVGADVPVDLFKLSSKNVTIKSNVMDEYLLELIDTTKLSIAPLRYGGGIKGKIVDSMQNGLPVITTSIGAEGLEAEKGHIAVASLEDFARKLTELYNDDGVLNLMSKASLRYVADHFSEQTMKQALKGYVSEI